MDDAPVTEALPPSLRFLKWLVIVLTLTMIGGVITVVAVIVTRMPQGMAAGPVLPDTLTLPPGTTAAAITAGAGWFAVVTTDDRILIFGRNGEMQQEIRVDPLPER
jgi:Flp pilus assembly protein protease CpaA